MNQSTKFPGFGVTIPYNAPGVKATVFVYDLRISRLPQGIDNPEVRAQARQAEKDVFAAYTDVRVLEPLAAGDRSCRKFLRAKFRYIDRRSDPSKTVHSLLYFSSAKANFIKVRLTYAEDLASQVGEASAASFAQAVCELTRQ